MELEIISQIVQSEKALPLIAGSVVGASVSYGWFTKKELEPHIKRCEEKMAILQSEIEELKVFKDKYITVVEHHSGLLENVGYVVK